MAGHLHFPVLMFTPFDLAFPRPRGQTPDGALATRSMALSQPGALASTHPQPPAAAGAMRHPSHVVRCARAACL